MNSPDKIEIPVERITSQCWLLRWQDIHFIYQHFRQWSLWFGLLLTDSKSISNIGRCTVHLQRTKCLIVIT